MTANGLYEELVIAGFGGQGVMLAGKLVAQTAMEAGRQTTYMPSYGAEVRGGTANCMVIVADRPVASPTVSRPNSLIVLNKASLRKFASRLRDDGLLIMNSSLIDEQPDVPDTVEVLAIDANDIAVELGSAKAVNMVALGAYLFKRGILTPDQVAAALPKVLAKRYHNTLELNIRALNRGAEFAENNA
jgi:2-oxoglutarate ferredoxin oxidoreductase subunit gamma